jgi:1-acyl-sn-glycerol-3-phosphate acyltransferase
MASEPKPTLFYRFILAGTKIYFKIFFRHKIYGQEHFYRGGGILAGNHTSFFDPPIVAISSPEEVHFLARDSLFHHFIFGTIIRALNSHPVSGDSSDISVFKTICALLKEGKKIVLFPEGTRSTDGELKEIKPGIGLLIMRTQTAIIPLYIDGAFEAWGRKRKLPKLFGKTACVFGSPIRAEEFAHLEKREAQQAIAQRLSQAIRDLKKWYMSGQGGIPP